MLIIDRKQCSSPVSPLLDVQNLSGPRPTWAKPSEGQAGGADLGLVCLVWDSIWDRHYEYLLFYHGPKPLWAKTYLGIGKRKCMWGKKQIDTLCADTQWVTWPPKWVHSAQNMIIATGANLCEQNLSGQVGGACKASNRSAPSVQTLNEWPDHHQNKYIQLKIWPSPPVWEAAFTY